MGLLVLGLVLFLGAHLVPTAPTLRQSLVSRMGERGYRGAFSGVAAAGLVLTVVGFARAPNEPVLFAPMPWAIAAAPSVVGAAFVLLAAARMRGHLRRIVRHPMLVGTLLWAGVHLAANGDARSTLLFGAFLAWALVDLASAAARGAVAAFEPKLAHDAIAVVAGGAAAIAFAWLHGALIGVQVVPFGLGAG